MSNEPKSEAHRIIVDGDIVVLVDAAKRLGKELAPVLTTSQIRNVFGEVRRIEMAWSASADDETMQHAFRSVVLLQPKLAYQANRDRERTQGVKALQAALDPCLLLIQGAAKSERRTYFLRFVDYFEAILAYHKAAGGKNVGGNK